MFVKYLFSRKKHCFIIFPYNVEIDFLIPYGLVTCLNYQKYCPIIWTPRPFFHAFLIYFPASRDTIFDGVRTRLRKVASSASLYKKLLSARWRHIPNPLEQANRLATQFLRIAIFFRWNFLQK